MHGGGKSGVMGNLTSGAQSQQGAVYGVVHKMFCVDNGEDERLVQAKGGGLLVVGGPDLVERKQKLVDSGECLVILPGGVGTFEEMCETVSAKSLGMMGLKNKGICVVNIDGFFDGWLPQMDRAHLDGLLYGPVNSFFDLVTTPEEAISWTVKQMTNKSPNSSSRANSPSGTTGDATGGVRLYAKKDSQNDGGANKGIDDKMPQEALSSSSSSSSNDETISTALVVNDNSNNNNNSNNKSSSRSNSSDNSRVVYSFIFGLTLGVLGMTYFLRRK